VPELNLVIPAFLDRALKNEMARTETSASSSHSQMANLLQDCHLPIARFKNFA
jgi:hypothetical protein